MRVIPQLEHDAAARIADVVFGPPTSADEDPQEQFDDENRTENDGAKMSRRRPNDKLMTTRLPGTKEALPDFSERASDLVLLWWRGQDLNL